MVFVGAKLKNTRKNNHELLSLTEEGQLESSEDLQSHKGLDLSSLAWALEWLLQPAFLRAAGVGRQGLSKSTGLD